MGSFLNVFSLRYNPRKSKIFNLKRILGRSRCPSCGKKLKWYELIPLLSFVVQIGKCRSCGHCLSWQYPLVELASGTIFVAVPWFLSKFYGPAFLLLPLSYSYALSALWIVVFMVLLVITIIDIRHYIVPNELSTILLILGGAVLFVKTSISGMVLPLQGSFLKHYALIFSPFSQPYLNHLLGALLAFAFFAILIIGSRGKAIGWGDAKLGFVLGLIFGWPEIGLILVLSFVLGGSVGALLILAKKKKMSGRLPFAPFLSLGSFTTFFAGFLIITWYFGLFGF